jgi:hypothetical protein
VLLGPAVKVMRKKVRQRDQHGKQSAHLLAGVGRAGTNTRSQILVRPLVLGCAAYAACGLG